MGGSHLEVLQGVYGFNWAAVGGREDGLGRMAEIVADDFEAQLSPEVGGRTVRGIEELRQFAYALEADFAVLTYDPEQFRELAGDRILVLGRIHGRGRVSAMPVEGEFGHVWSFVNHQPRSIRAFLSHARALEAVGARSVDGGDNRA